MNIATVVLMFKMCLPIICFMTLVLRGITVYIFTKPAMVVFFKFLLYSGQIISFQSHSELYYVYFPEELIIYIYHLIFLKIKHQFNYLGLLQLFF